MQVLVLCITLLALLDHRYHFRYVNVGSPGTYHDAHVDGRSRLREMVESDTFQSPVSLIEDITVAPVTFSDLAFFLTSNVTKPFSNAATKTREAAFNYNL